MGKKTLRKKTILTYHKALMAKPPAPKPRVYTAVMEDRGVWDEGMIQDETAETQCFDDEDMEMFARERRDY